MGRGGGGHLPFQVLDASAIEGIRGLVGESSSIYICIQIYKALTPPAPPPAHWKGGGYPDPALQAAQPTPSHCLPNAKCQFQWCL